MNVPLTEAAEYIEKLEAENAKLQQSDSDMSALINKLDQKIAELKNALGFYANTINWKQPSGAAATGNMTYREFRSKIEEDVGERARKVLGK